MKFNYIVCAFVCVCIYVGVCVFYEVQCKMNFLLWVVVELLEIHCSNCEL